MLLFVLLSFFILFFLISKVNSRQSFFFLLYFFIFIFSILVFSESKVFFGFSYSSFLMIFLCLFFLFSVIIIHEVFLLDLIVTWLYLVVLFFLFFATLLIIQFFDLLSVFFFLEIQNIFIFGFLCFRSKISESYRETVRFFFFSTFISCFSMFGLSLIYFSTGTLELHLLVHFLHRFMFDNIFVLGNFLFFINFFFKLTFFPFYIWLIYLFQAASLVGLFIVLIIVKFIVFILLSINLSFLFFFLDFLILPFGILSLSFSVFSILYEYSIKGFFAFSSIVHTILLAFLLLSNGFDSFSNIFFCFIIYAINMFGIFIMLIFFDRLELDQFSKLYGLFKSNPFVSLFFFLILLSLAGIPPFPGFFQKYLIMKSLFNMNYFIAFVFIIFCSLIIGFYYLRLVALFVGTEVESPVFTLRLSSLGIRSLEFIAYLHLASIFFLYDFFAWCYYVAINLSSAWC